MSLCGFFFDLLDEFGDVHVSEISQSAWVINDYFYMVVS